MLSSEECERDAEALFHRKLGDFDVVPDCELPGGRLLFVLQSYTWNVNELRTAVVPPERRAVYISKRNSLESIRADIPVYSESLHSGPIFDACMAVLPEGLRFDFVTVNKNLCCYPHRDSGNEGQSLILFLGKFEGGALLTEDGRRFSEPGVLHVFDGSKLHWNEPITGGTKYSIVFYNRISASLRSASPKIPQESESRVCQDLNLASGFKVPFDLYEPA